MKTRTLSIAIISALSVLLLAGCAEGTNSHSAAAETRTSKVEKSDKSSVENKAPESSKKDASAKSESSQPAVTSSTPDDSQGTDQTASSTTQQSNSTAPAESSSQAVTTSEQSSSQPAASTTQSSQSVATQSSQKQAASSSVQSTIPLAQFYGKWVGADTFTLYYNASGVMVISQHENMTKTSVVAEPMADGRILFRATSSGVNNVLATVKNGHMYLSLGSYDSTELTRDASWNGQLPE